MPQPGSSTLFAIAGVILQHPEPLCFLIADVSGSTGHLPGVELDNALDILTDLIGANVTARALPSD
ncbi:MAG: hypothetical protein WBZ40_08030 [Acidimicrobiia bacterium]